MFPKPILILFDFIFTLYPQILLDLFLQNLSLICRSINNTISTYPEDKLALYELICFKTWTTMTLWRFPTK